MRTPNPDRERQARPAVRLSGRGAALVGMAAVLALLALDAALAGQNPANRRAAADAARARDTVPIGDLRCLTRRAEDCLDEPVPRDEPHGAVCATCHSLWERGSTSGGTIQSCSGGECHLRPETLTPFHETVSAATLEDCTGCHVAHSFRVPERGADCTVCHTGGGQAAAQAHGTPARHLPPNLVFEHGEHTDLACNACHTTRAEHGAFKVTQRLDCVSCHHVSPVADDCVGCHTRSEINPLSFTVTRKLNIRIGSLDQPLRTLRFEHARHATSECRTCHIGANLEAPPSTDCSSCHFEHHEATANCSACHETPAAGAHDRRSHLGCGGVGCHDPVPPGIEWAPRARPLCLACHTDLAAHKPDRNCVECHVLPPPSGPAQPKHLW